MDGARGQDHFFLCVTNIFLVKVSEIGYILNYIK